MIQPTTLNWPSTIEFGVGKIQTLKNHLAGFKNVFVLVDAPILLQVQKWLDEIIKSQGVDLMISTEVTPEPPFEALEKLLIPVRDYNPQAVVGIGGGSAMDTAKLISVLYDGQQKAPEVVGIGQVKTRKVKLITASTTSGTGSEVTPIAVLTDLQQKTKKGVVSPFIVPDVAIVDPELTITAPAAITASTGVDALTHCIEAYTNQFSHPVIDNIALEGVRLISHHLVQAVKNGKDLEARTAMSLGSLYGGMCLGPVNTAAVHALAYPLGGEFKNSHGVSNSVLLPFVMKFNLPKCYDKYANVARAFGIKDEGTNEQMAEKAILKIRKFLNKPGFPQAFRN